ncbi:hypothetical protein DFH06DRAFT_1229608 [Mycena polygramma]|nr:hypothetical protein DFH06DRAFT_1229608 [Mycena polygramma]
MEALIKDARYSLFCHNPLHDLESTAWIAIWIITMRTCNSDGTLMPTQKNTWKKYFGPQAADRLLHRRFAIQNTDTLPPQNFPSELVHVVNSLVGLRDALHLQYTRFETTLDLPDMDLEHMFETFIQQFQRAATLSANFPPFVGLPKDSDVQSDDVEDEDTAPKKKEGKRRRGDHGSDEEVDEKARTEGPTDPSQRPGPSKRVKQGTASAQPPRQSGSRKSERLAASAKNSKGHK